MIISSVSSLKIEQSALKLPRYAQIVEYEECMFYGIQRPGQENYACRTFWTKLERDSVARYLGEAEEEIEEILNWKIGPTWVQSVVPWRPSNVVFGRWCDVIVPGVKSETTLELNSALDHSDDPAVVGPVAIPATVTDPESVVLYHPGTDVEIFPSNVVLGDVGSVGGYFATIEVPRCRLVKQEFANNDPSFPLNYNDPGVGGPFLQEVDVAYRLNDSSTQGFLLYSDGYRAPVDMLVLNHKIAEFRLAAPGSVGGICVTSPSIMRGGLCPTQVELNYYSGRELSSRMEDMVLRLAHAKMPSEPCGCDVVQRLWRRDRFVPEVLTRERLNCPFGLSDGAWVSYKFSQQMKVYRSLGSLV